MEEFEEMVTCPICFEEKELYLTACGHNGCLECLLRLRECHECRQKFNHSFKPIKNYSLMRMIEVIKKKKFQPPKPEHSNEALYFTNENWRDLIVNPNIIDNIELGNWSYPTRVQAEVIPKIISRQNLLVESWNGTGKTGSFAIGTLCQIDPEYESLQVVSFSHTKEIKDMHAAVYTSLAQNTGIIIEKTEKNKLYSNNQSYSNEKSYYLPYTHVLCGTVESVFKYFKVKDIKTECLTFVIDESDEILKSQENIQKINTILSRVNYPQVLLYSATLSDITRAYAYDYLSGATEISIKAPLSLNPKVKIFNIMPERGINKRQLAYNLISSLTCSMCIIFLNKKNDGLELKTYFENQGFKTDYFSGDLSVSEREEIIEHCQLGKIKIIISTDVLGRGFDCKSLDLVINYDCPKNQLNRTMPNFEAYYHRCGRTGRYTRSGTVINLIDLSEHPLYQKIFSYFDISPRITNDFSEVYKALELNSNDYLLC